MKKLIVLATLLAVTASQGAVVRWGGNALGGTDSWSDGNSWFDTAIAPAPYGVPTSPTDSHALIGNQSGAFGPITMPVVTSALANVPDVIGVGWDESYGELTIAPGGSMNANFMYLGWGGVVSTGKVSVTGGSIVVGNLSLGSGGDNRATVEVTSGFLHAGTVNLGAGAFVNLSGAGLFFVNGDQTGFGLPGSIVVSLDGAGTSIQESFDGSITKFEVIPEPATLGLVAALGGALLFIRRKFVV